MYCASPDPVIPGPPANSQTNAAKWLHARSTGETCGREISHEISNVAPTRLKLKRETLQTNTGKLDSASPARQSAQTTGQKLAPPVRPCQHHTTQHKHAHCLMVSQRYVLRKDLRSMYCSISFTSTLLSFIQCHHPRCPRLCPLSSGNGATAKRAEGLGWVKEASLGERYCSVVPHVSS